MPKAALSNTNASIRQPQQARSKEAWRRILDAGRQLLEDGGSEALTIIGVCEAADVAPTAIYARVDGLSDLFWAIYEDGMHDVIDTYTDQLTKASQTPPHSKERVEAVVAAVAVTFENHHRFLQPVINYSISNPNLRDRGSEASIKLVSLVADLLDDGDRKAAYDVARMLQQEAILRAMYGDRWLSIESESFDDFEERLAQMAISRLGF
ncbi:MAG: hypothetical protein RI926_1228 [Actinomycetota bacterium]|jgi:AcrR family transcriptional regulator